MTSAEVVTSRASATADRALELRGAEQRFFGTLGVRATERVLSLERPACRVRVLEVGEGPPVVHVHGGGAFGAIDGQLAAALPGRRHILLDRPGFGLSEAAPCGPDFRASSIELLLGVVDALELERPAFVGNSIGAAMALWLALAHPRRVRSLGLVGGTAMVGNTTAPFILRLLATPVIGPLMIGLERPSAGQVRTLWTRFGHDPDRVPPALSDVLLAVERMPAYPKAWFECLAATQSLGGTRPGLEISDDELRSLNLPVAFAWGEKDPMVPLELGRRVAALVPGAQLTVSGVGHLPWIDDARAVARAIEPVLGPLGS